MSQEKDETDDVQTVVGKSTLVMGRSYESKVVSHEDEEKKDEGTILRKGELIVNSQNFWITLNSILMTLDSRSGGAPV